MGDFNIDPKTKGFGFNKLYQFCDLFNLTNLIKTETLFTKSHKSLIDFFLTYQSLSFVAETGLSISFKIVYKKIIIQYLVLLQFNLILKIYYFWFSYD